MARFYAGIKGCNGEASRMGTPSSGIRGHIRGWDVGIKVDGYVDQNGDDCFQVYLTSGSNNRKTSKFIGSFKASNL